MQLDGCDGEIYGTIRVMSIMNIVSLEFVSDFIVLILDIMCTVSTILNPPHPSNPVPYDISIVSLIG